MRYTETKLDKIVRIGMARIDQVFDKCCDDLEKLKPADEAEEFYHRSFGRLFRDSELSSMARQQQMGFANALNNAASMGRLQ
jgi:hypothetical protein